MTDDPMTNGEVRQRVRDLERQLAELKRDMAVVQTEQRAECKARDLAAETLDAWKGHYNEWQARFAELSATFVTRESLDLRLRNIWAVAVTLVTVTIAATTLTIRLFGGTP